MTIHDIQRLPVGTRLFHAYFDIDARQGEVIAEVRECAVYELANEWKYVRYSDHAMVTSGKRFIFATHEEATRVLAEQIAVIRSKLAAIAPAPPAYTRVSPDAGSTDNPKPCPVCNGRLS